MAFLCFKKTNFQNSSNLIPLKFIPIPRGSPTVREILWRWIDFQRKQDAECSNEVSVEQSNGVDSHKEIDFYTSPKLGEETNLKGAIKADLALQTQTHSTNLTHIE